jgi:putative peptide zinc metalloprotease protein
MSALCPHCRRIVERDATWCVACGRELAQDAPPLELVLPDGTGVALVETMSIGRAPHNAICLADPSVSRVHARILAPGPEQGPVLTDAGSTHRTFLDGEHVTRPQPLRDGSRIRVGDTRLTVQRRRDRAAAGRTVVVRAGMSLVLPLTGSAEMGVAPSPGGMRPRPRAGIEVKRLEAAEGDRRWILRDPGGTAILALGEPEALLFELLDGRRTLAELVGVAERRGGASGRAVLMALLVDLGEHGVLEGVEGAQEQPSTGPWRVLTPRVFCLRAAGDAFDRLYRGGGWVLFTSAGLRTLVAIAAAGVVAFAVAIAGDYATPFVVAHRVGLGGLVFIAGRLLVVALHETAHGLTLNAFGRRVERSGVKFILGFPYAFVDTSVGLFEPKRRRLAISASGPLSDLVVGGLFAFVCIAAPSVTAREVSLQIALSAYTGALFNLNPLLDRDGYHMLVDWLGIPNLRRQARSWLAAGGRREAGTEAVARYAVATIAWSLLTAAFVIVLSLRYADRLLALAPDGIVWVVLGCFWALVLIPAAVGIAGPVRGRVRAGGGTPG